MVKRAIKKKMVIDNNAAQLAMLLPSSSSKRQSKVRKGQECLPRPQKRASTTITATSLIESVTVKSKQKLQVKSGISNSPASQKSTVAKLGCRRQPPRAAKASQLARAANATSKKPASAVKPKQTTSIRTLVQREPTRAKWQPKKPQSMCGSQSLADAWLGEVPVGKLPIMLVEENNLYEEKEEALEKIVAPEKKLKLLQAVHHSSDAVKVVSIEDMLPEILEDDEDSFSKKKTAVFDVEMTDPEVASSTDSSSVQMVSENSTEAVFEVPSSPEILPLDLSVKRPSLQSSVPPQVETVLPPGTEVEETALTASAVPSSSTTTTSIVPISVTTPKLLFASMIPTTISKDPFTTFLRQQLPSFTPNLLLEHVGRYFADVFVSPESHTVAGSLYALHLDQHWHNPEPTANERGYKSVESILEEVMTASSGRGSWSDLYVNRLFTNGYIEKGLESLMIGDGGSGGSMRDERRKERKRLPAFFNKCSDCRTVLLQLLYLVNSPVLSSKKKMSGSVFYSLHADVRQFLTTERTFVDYYNYFKPSVVEGRHIANCLQLYCMKTEEEEDFV